MRASLGPVLQLVVAALVLVTSATTTNAATRTRNRTSLRDWRVKGTVQRVLGLLPAGERLHGVLQRRFGGLANFERECDTKVEDWRLMVGHLREAGVELQNARMLEIGTGWYPTFPYCLYLAGVRHVVSIDLTPHFADDLERRMVARLATHLPTIAEAASVPLRDVQDRYRHLVAKTPDVTRTLEFRAPADATATKLPPHSVDLVFSNSVLEHVPAAVIRSMFREARRILRPGGAMFHSVNCGDHYAYSDPSLHQLHYLQFSDDEWQRWNNRFLYQNRLRAIDFTTMARDAGFAIELDTSTVRPERLAALERIQVHPQFARYTREQLAITSIDFIARKG